MQQLGKQLTKKLQSVAELVDKYKGFVFDMDGILFLGSKPIQYSFEFLHYLKSKQKKVLFLTNNSSVNRQAYVEKLTKNGYPVQESEIYCASSIAAQYIKENIQNPKKVYVIGMEGIGQELRNVGITEIVGSRQDETISNPSPEYFGEIKVDPDINIVVVGIDYTINYYKLTQASLAIVQNKAAFIATNEDQYIKMGPYSNLLPGGGTMVRALAKCTQIEPTVTGKPNPYCLDLICQQHDLEKENLIMIGDNLQTDIQFGINGKIDTLLVMTGVCTQEELDNELQKMTKDSAIPTYYVENLKI